MRMAGGMQILKTLTISPAGKSLMVTNIGLTQMVIRSLAGGRQAVNDITLNPELVTIWNVHYMCQIMMERRELDHSKNIKVGIRYS